MSDKDVILGGIIKHNQQGVGFKITFKNTNTANYYKDMIRWILINDQYPIIYNKGYYDKYDMDGFKNE